MPAASPRLNLVLVLISNALIPLAIGIFAVGFFPYKPFLPGRNVYRPDLGPPPPPVFDKLIFMVVDALRSDFVYSNESSFDFVQSLIRSGAAIPFTAHATSPTITMPRVKALTTGSVPSFLDVILNFAESDTTSILANQDTWPTQLGAKPLGKVLMYGDDTWLKLFPDVFSRSDGTSSFFVSDFTEVDNNVTRHVPYELDQSDWNGMIMHYLGLDHIGHKSGPRSPHMRPKQKEMDNIVRQIYSSIESNPHLNSTLFILCGDHGMNEAGNHGGSSPGETSPALVFMSPKLQKVSGGFESPVLIVDDEFQYYEVVEQSDVAPTLAGLLGFPVPLNNLGVFMERLLLLWSTDSDRIDLVRQNAEQVYDIVKATFGDRWGHPHQSTNGCSQTKSDGELLHCLWSASVSQAEGSSPAQEKIDSVLVFLRNAQRIMSSTASNYDVRKLQQGVSLAMVSALTIAYAAISMLLPTRGTLFTVIVLCSTYGAMMFASSFVEEEHHFWYWSASGWIASIWVKSVRRTDFRIISQGAAAAILLGAFRLVRRWNQTGQKHAGAPDVGRTFLATQPWLLWFLVALTLIGVGYGLNKSVVATTLKLPFLSAFSAVIVSALGFKISFTAADAPELLTEAFRPLLGFLNQISLTTQAKTVFIGIGLLSLAIIVQNRFLSRRASLYSCRTLDGLHALLTLLLITQSRANNIPLFLLFQVQLEIMKMLKISIDEIILASIFMQYASYFAFGGTNAISSVDLSSAYNGVSSYNVLAVGMLTFVGNWAGPIWWSLGCYILLLERSKGASETFIRYMVLHTTFVSASVTCVMLACTVLRTHLFIWTVFSPKFLYSMAWSLGQHLAINGIAGSAIWAFGLDT